MTLDDVANDTDNDGITGDVSISPSGPQTCSVGTPVTFTVTGETESDTLDDVKLVATIVGGVEDPPGGDSCWDDELLTVAKVVLIPPVGYPLWVPEKDGEITIKAKIYPDALTGYFTFNIEDSTEYPGYCMNAPWPVPTSGEHSSTWNDLRFRSPQSGFLIGGAEEGQADSTVGHRNESDVIVKANDYAAWGRLRCRAEITRETETVFCDATVQDSEASHLIIPKDDNGNLVADAETEYDVGGILDDDDRLTGVEENSFKGDALTRFEEYRGVILADEGHLRPDPEAQDYFLYNDDSLDIGVFQSASHLAVHEIANDGRTPSDVVGQVQNGYILNFAKTGYGDNKDQRCPTLEDDPAGPHWDGIALHARIDLADIEVAWIFFDRPPGWQDLEIPSVVAHELGHSCDIPHHGGGSAPGVAGSKGPECIMRYYCPELMDAPTPPTFYCTCATPGGDCSNVECDEPVGYDWNCEAGRCNCITKINVNPIP